MTDQTPTLTTTATPTATSLRTADIQAILWTDPQVQAAWAAIEDAQVTLNAARDEVWRLHQKYPRLDAPERQVATATLDAAQRAYRLASEAYAILWNAKREALQAQTAHQ